ncbi:chromosomal replication initiator protein DnaA [Treponema sp.]|uniref:chromosomal replication initiator protein DnaA n=1 Tax=Treponema sp. TaxID=166 RepID=UPI003890EBCE
MGNQNYKVFWQEALNQLRQEYKAAGEEDVFELWFRMDYVEDDANIIKVSVPSEFMRNQMESKGCFDQISKKLSLLTGQSEIKIETQITNSQISSVSDAEQTPEPFKNSDKAASSSEKSEKADSSKPHHPQLLERYTFDTFVSGDNNNFAYSAALAAAKKPGKAYNPLLLYGGVGLGKTHLMQSIGNYIYEHSDSKLKICCVPAENFLNEFTDSLKNNTPNKFKNKYRNLDVLLLDDIHFLQGKESLQEETFHTFNSLNERGAQMVFTCDRPINELKGIEDRLKTRFSSGVCIDMQPPGYEVRCAIIKKKLDILEKNIEEDVIDFIAKNIQLNVRDLEAAIKTVVGYQDLIGKKVTVDIAKDILKDTISNATGNSVSMETILKVIADIENTSIADIKGKKRNKKIAETRHIAIYIARELLEYSYPELGNEFGGRDHSTILSAYNNIADRIKTDPSFDSRIKGIINAIKDYKKI